nr:flagellin [uncultured Devosia sp.]
MVDINLSKSVRSNLSSLQSTASLMNKTSDRLSTGNKVNSALDNPTNFFTASSLNSRAGDLNQLMDSMANGIKTIEAADNGLTSITKTLESMQSTLRQARQDKTFQTKSFELSPTATGNISFSGGAIGTAATSIALENTDLTAAAFGLGTAPAAGTAGTAGPPATAGTQAITWGGNPIDVNKNAKISFTATIDGNAQEIEISRADVMRAGNGDGTINDATEFASILTAKLGTSGSASATGNAITVTSATTGTTSSVAVGAATVTGTAFAADELVKTINDNPALAGKIRASNDDGKLRIENQSTQELNIDGITSGGIVNGTGTASKIGGNTVRADLATQFNELRDQLDKLSDDASFNGINLLRGDKLTITFNETGTSSIDVQAKDEDQLNAAKLNVFDVEAQDLDSDGNIDNLLSGLKTALNTVRSQSSAFGSNLSVVQNRQDFTQKMINTLETGAGNLTLADMNQEAANMMALQTRQSLASSTLSMANQADQNVLQLLR